MEEIHQLIESLAKRKVELNELIFKDVIDSLSWVQVIIFLKEWEKTNNTKIDIEDLLGEKELTVKRFLESIAGKSNG